MKNKGLMAIVLTVVVLAIVFCLVMLNGLMSEVEAAMPQIDASDSTTGGDTTKDNTGNESGDNTLGDETESPVISYANAEFVLMEPAFYYSDIKQVAGMTFRACVSFDFKEKVAADKGTFYMLISPLDIVLEVIEASGDALVIDWVTAMQTKQETTTDGRTVYLKQEITDEEFTKTTQYWIAKDEMGNIKYANHNRVMVGIPLVEYTNGSRQYASFLDPDNENYKTMARSYAYLCSEVYTAIEVDGVSYVAGAQTAVKEALMKSANLASGVNDESAVDTSLQFVLSLDTIVKTLKVGESFQLTQTFVPEVSLYYVWRTADETIATVEEGLVFAGELGNTKVTIHMGNLTAECVISVIDDACETVKCENCSHEYWPGDVSACPVCNGYTRTLALFCHCGCSIPYDMQYDGDGNSTCLDESLQCPGCGCRYVYNSTGKNYEKNFDCTWVTFYCEVCENAVQLIGYDGVTCSSCGTVYYERTIECHCDHTVSWFDYQKNGVWQWEWYVVCTNCYCEYDPRSGDKVMSCSE